MMKTNGPGCAPLTPANDNNNELACIGIIYVLCVRYLFDGVSFEGCLLNDGLRVAVVLEFLPRFHVCYAWNPSLSFASLENLERVSGLDSFHEKSVAEVCIMMLDSRQYIISKDGKQGVCGTK